MKKYLAFPLLLLTAMFCVLAGACREQYIQEEYTEGLKFEITDGYYTVVIDGNPVDRDVVIPSKYRNKPVKAIGRCAFYGYNLTSVVIPDSVECIDDMAFAYCKDLTTVKIGKNVNNIVGGAFAGCSSLKSIVIPDKVPAIEINTFEDCTALSSVTIGIGVTQIVGRAFHNCISLTDVYYRGNESDWNKIMIDSTYNEYLLNATIHFAEYS